MMHPAMTFNQLLKHYKTQAAVARALRIKPSSVFEWRLRGIPDDRQLQIQRATGGQLKADAAVLERLRRMIQYAEAA